VPLFFFFSVTQRRVLGDYGRDWGERSVKGESNSLPSRAVFRRAGLVSCFIGLWLARNEVHGEGPCGGAWEVERELAGLRCIFSGEARGGITSWYGKWSRGSAF